MTIVYENKQLKNKMKNLERHLTEDLEGKLSEPNDNVKCVVVIIS